MGTPAFRTSESAYPETELPVPYFNGTAVGAMPGEAGAASAGAFELMELEGINNFIIKILRKGVVKFVLNGYHNSVRWHKPQEVWGRNEALVGGIPAFFMLQDHMITQKPLVSNNLMENTSNFFVPGAYLICLKNLKKVECNLPDNNNINKLHAKIQGDRQGFYHHPVKTA